MENNSLKRTFLFYREINQNDFPNEKKIFVYLTPEGDESENENDSYEPISYEFVVDTLEKDNISLWRIIKSTGEKLYKRLHYNNKKRTYGN